MLSDNKELKNSTKQWYSLNPLERVTCFQTWLRGLELVNEYNLSQSPRTGHMLSDITSNLFLRNFYLWSQSPRTGHMLSDGNPTSCLTDPALGLNPLERVTCFQTLSVENLKTMFLNESQSPRTGHMLSDGVAQKYHI